MRGLRIKLRDLKRNWPKIRQKIIQNMWRIVVAIIVLILVILLIGAFFTWLITGKWPDWTGFGEYIGPAVQTNQTYQRAKTLWDLMGLLIIPAILAGGAYWLNESARQREREIAEQNRQETALQTYLDKITELLLKEKLRESERYLFTWEFITESGIERLIEFLMRKYHIDWIKTAKVEKTDDNRAIRVYTEKNSLFLRLTDEEGVTGVDLGINYSRIGYVDLGIDDSRIGYLITKKENGKLNVYSEEPNLDVRAVARVRTLTVLHRLDKDRKRALLKFLYEADLIYKDKRVINLTGADLSGADLSGEKLIDAKLSGADLSGADLSDANLNGAYLEWADLRWAKLNEAFLEWADLSGADLSGADLSGADLNFAILSDADLSGAKLNGAYLSDADLSRAKLNGAYLSGANLSDANLSDANLSGAKMSGANLSDSKLEGAKYTKDAKDIRGTIWPKVFDPKKAGAICVNE